MEIRGPDFIEWLTTELLDETELPAEYAPVHLRQSARYTAPVTRDTWS